MKLNRTYLFIAITSAALLIVLIIQVNWTLQAAQAKKEMFNEKANMVLSRTAEALSADKQVLGRITRSDVRKVDSLFRHFMKLYNFQIAYYFEVKSILPTSTFSDVNPPGCYVACVKRKDMNGDLELKLVFPDKEEFIMAEMGIPFITSVILIFLVLVMSWRTILSLMKEKMISEHTTDFLNNMTHEFKTPVTNIALAAKMLSKDQNIKQEEKIRHYSGIILDENEKLRLQVEQVLNMTAFERNEIPLQKTELDVHELISNAVRNMGVQLESRQGNISADLKAENFVINGDKTHFTNALSNLIDNAIKYSSAKPEINIETLNEQENLVVKISDKGIGIDEKYRQKVFDKFFRVPTGDVHNVKGFGLGLAYTKKIIELHGGNIGLESEKGKGTTFIITLPHA
jgi:two-component system phosphate regulon sensor histidine kinase PhoR